MRIAVLGGGVAGLACAYYLARGGHAPLVLEPSDALGQLGAPIVHEGLRIDRFSNPLRNSDTALCGLLADLGGLGRVAWRPTRSAVAMNGNFYPVSSASDLLRTAGLAGLSGRDWVRAGLGLTYATQLKRYALHLHDVPAAQWLPRVFGRRVYEGWWRPFLEVRFGDYAEDVPAYWVWRQLNAYQTGRREIFGYLRGGIGWLAERLRRSIEARGGEVRLHAAVTAVESRPSGCSVEVDGCERRVEAVVSTLPPGELAKLAGGRLAAELPNLDVPYQGNVTALVILQKRVGDFYQTAFLERNLPFPRSRWEAVICCTCATTADRTPTPSSCPTTWCGSRRSTRCASGSPASTAATSRRCTSRTTRRRSRSPCSASCAARSRAAFPTRACSCAPRRRRIRAAPAGTPK